MPRWCMLASLILLPALTCAQPSIEVASKRAITGAPLLFQSQPDPEIPGRFVSFTPNGCALSFSASAVRGLVWSGACPDGRMQGRGTVIGYDYEQQPVFFFEGYIERGLRKSGVMHESDRKDGKLIGRRTVVADSAVQPYTEVAFLDMPRPYLLALDDWSRQTDGKDLLASLGATWAPGFARMQAERSAKESRETFALLGNALAAAAGGTNAAERRQLALNALAGTDPSASGSTPVGGSGAGSCERKEFKIITTYSGGMRGEKASWSAQNCGHVLYRKNKKFTNSNEVSYQNTCGCNIVMYVDRDGRHILDGRSEKHLKAHQTTPFGPSWTDEEIRKGRTLPKVRGSCDEEGLMGGDYPSYDEETDTCRVRPCSLNNTCSGGSGTAK